MEPFRRHGLFASLAIVAVAAHTETVRALLAYGERDASASHLLLVPVVSLALVWFGRRAIFRRLRFAPRAGGLVILAGVALSVAGLWRWPVVPPDPWFAAAPAGLALLMGGGFLLVYGPAAARGALFPLCFLALMVPIPAPLLDAAVQGLKAGTAEVVSALFTVTGTPHYREGYVFSLPGLAIEIADECSGIRSTIALLLTSLLGGYVFLQHPASRVLLVLAIVPVTLVKNGIRIATLSLLSIHVDPSFISGQLHHDGGIVFFLVSLLMLAPLFLVLHRRQAARGAAAPAPAVHTVNSAPSQGRTS